MTQQKKIQEILSQKNYQITNGKVLRYDMMDDKFKPVIVSGNRIPLVKDGEVVEIFVWDDCKKVIDSMNGAAMDGLHTNGKLPESVVEDGAAKMPDAKVDDWDEFVDLTIKKDKPKKEVMTKEKTVKKLKKVIEKAEKKNNPILIVPENGVIKATGKTAKFLKSVSDSRNPKKKSTRKPYKTGLHRGNLSKENIEFIQNEARKDKGMTVADMAKKFGVGRLTVDHHWKKAAKWVKTKVLIPQKKKAK